MNEATYKAEWLYGKIPDATHLLDCSLKILIFPTKIYSVLFSRENKLLFSQLFTRVKEVPYSVFLRYLFVNEAFLRATYRETVIFEAESPFTFIPIQFAKETQRLEVVHAMIDDTVFAEEYQSQWLQKEEMEILFVPDSGLKAVLNEFVPHHTLIHISACNLTIAQNLAEEFPSHMLINLYETVLMITVIKDKQLLLCQSYPWSSYLDVVYFIQLIKEMNGWKDAKVPLFILGEIRKAEVENNTLWEFIPRLEIPKAESIHPDLKEHAEWWRYGVLCCGGKMTAVSRQPSAVSQSYENHSREI